MSYLPPVDLPGHPAPVPNVPLPSPGNSSSSEDDRYKPREGSTLKPRRILIITLLVVFLVIILK